MKLSERWAFILSAAAAAVFMAAALVWALGFVSGGAVEIDARKVSSAEIMIGGNDPQSAALELLPGELININTADEQELERLPGIGGSLADAIIEYRAAQGDFESIEEIMEVPGIGEGRFAAIAGNITVGDMAA